MTNLEYLQTLTTPIQISTFLYNEMPKNCCRSKITIWLRDKKYIDI